MLEPLHTEKIDPVLRRAVSSSWDAASSKSNRWRPDNPALGQCVVSSLVVQDYMGGRIIRADVFSAGRLDDAHFYNFVDDIEIDMTRQQFGDDIELLTVAVDSSGGTMRSHLLRNRVNRMLYEFFRIRVQTALRQNGI